jgi:CheY-like chemotaxis protein
MASLKHGSEVTISGNTPAGCALAAALLASAQMRGLRLTVRIYDENPSHSLEHIEALLHRSRSLSSASSSTAAPPAVIGPLTRHRLAALGVVVPDEFRTVEVTGIQVAAFDRAEVIPVESGSAWIIDGWPNHPPGERLISAWLAQAAALRGARFIDRPLESMEAHPSGVGLALRAAGAPGRADVLVIAHANWPGRHNIDGHDDDRPGQFPFSMPPRKSAVRARLFAPQRAMQKIGTWVRVVVTPTPEVELLLAVPGTSSLHLTAIGRQLSAQDLALALAESVRSGILPGGMEIAELARASVPWGAVKVRTHRHVFALGEALAGHALDPWTSSLEQGQWAALALIESANELDELSERLQLLLSESTSEVSLGVKALTRLMRAGRRGPKALARPTSTLIENGPGLLFGLGPGARTASRLLRGASVWGRLERLWRDEGPGIRKPVQGERPVFVVDDDPEQRALVCEYLAARQVPVRAFPDELSLLAAAVDEPPRAVVLDLVLDWVDGLRLCRSLKSHPATRDTPVFVVSGLTRRSDRLAALAAGAVEFFPKPIDLEALFWSLRRWAC